MIDHKEVLLFCQSAVVGHNSLNAKNTSSSSSHLHISLPSFSPVA